MFRDFSEAKSRSPTRVCTRPFIRSVKSRVYWPAFWSKTGKVPGRSLAGMTKVLVPSWPMVTAVG